MGEGLENLLFVLFVAIAAIIQGVAAKKKKQQRQGEARKRAPGRSGLPEMTGSASAEDDDGPVDIFTKLARAGAERDAHGPATEEDSSEDLIPKEIWQEIAELAVGRRAPEPTPKAPPTPAPESPPSRERAQLHEVEADSREHGRMRAADLRTRSASPPTPAVAEKVPAPDRSRKLAAEMGEGATPAPDLQLEVAEEEKGMGRMEWLFGGKSPETLRRAILVREVLDPPLALREEE